MNEKYNKKRKQILLEIDRGESFNVEELAMYDLTPYFNEVDEPNLYETIILNKNQKGRLLILMIIYIFHHHKMVP